MNERDRSRLQHMLEAARRITELAQGHVRADLGNDSILVDALMWRFTIIGEAASRVSPEGRAALPMLPWTDIVAMRNRLVHGYDAVDLSLVWDTVSNDLPPMIAAVEQVLVEPLNTSD